MATNDDPAVRDERLIRLAEAITDDAVVDWAAQRQQAPDLAGPLANLQMLARIADVRQGGAGGGAGAALTGTAWGPLEIRGVIGEGSYGTVYRAHDPQLQRDVALKLLREDRVGLGHARRVLAEARLMARVRHPNVLVIHGADEHDGRVGFWTDLLAGETLEQRLAAGEVLGAGEAAAVGRELCRALGAVHGAGLVHGDVKAANVMRDRDGNFVLMDFGSGSEHRGDDDGGPISGTPLALAPELLNGGAASPATDVYALGVLLYRLVTGRYPVEAASIAELRQRHAEGASRPLLDLRPDLPADFARAVEGALIGDPAGRYRSAGAFERALARASGAAREHGPRWWAGLGVIALLAVVALAVALRGSRLPVPTPGTTAPLTATTTFLRTAAGADEALVAGALVRPGDAMCLEVQLGQPATVYVLNEDRQGDVFVLFPIAQTDARNPLAADRPQRLPGTWQGRALTWQVTEGQGEERFLVVAAGDPISWLEAQLADLAAPRRDRRVDATRPAEPGGTPDRGLGVVTESASPAAAAPSTLGGIVARLATREDVWYSELTLYNVGR